MIHRLLSILKSILIRPYKKVIFLFKERQKNKLSQRAEVEYEILWCNEKNSYDNICYYSTYDHDSIVDPYVYYYLTELQRCGFTIILISTSKSISNQDLIKLKSLCGAVILRENLGYDFVSWKVGVKIFPPQKNTNSVLLANDSVYGPFFDLSVYLRTCHESIFDVIGMTDSWEFKYHIQSYFIILKRRVIENRFIEKYFESVMVEIDKQDLIKNYEIGLTQTMIRSGYRVGSISDYLLIKKNNLDQNSKLYKYRYNQTIYYWRDLLEHRTIPFLKKNVFQIIGIDEVSIRELEFILRNNNSTYDTSLIINNMKRNIIN